MLALLSLLSEYGPIVSAFVPAVVPVLDTVATAATSASITVPAFRVSWKGKHVQIGPIPIALVS